MQKTKNIMKIGINVSFLRKRGTGIGEVTHHFLTTLVRLVQDGVFFSNTRFVLYAEEYFTVPALDEAPATVRARFKKKVFLPRFYKRDDLVRKIWWERYSLAWHVRMDACDAFFSLYQCPTQLDGIAHVMLVHDLIPRLFPQYLDNARKRFYQCLTERAIVHADHITTVSVHTQKDIIRELGCAPKKVTTHYIDCDPLFKNYHVHARNCARVLEKYNLSAGYLYYGGGLDLRKNVERLLRAYKKLLTTSHGKRSSRHRVPPLVISGKLMPRLAPLIADVEALVKELNITRHVHILGFVPQEDLPALYKSAAIFIYPSLYEGFGLPVLEAMSMGTPVIASKASSIPEVGGDSVLYCNPYSIDDIAQNIAMLLEREDLRDKLRVRGLQRAARFSWEECVRDTMRIVIEKGRETALCKK